MYTTRIFLTLTALLGPLNLWGEAGKIFFMIPLTTISEKQVYIPLIDALAQRGHEIVVASITKSKYTAKNNIREFVPLSYKEFVGDIFSDPFEARRSMGRYTSLAFTDYDFIIKGCERVYENPEFQKVLTEKFDLVFRNFWAGPCFNGPLFKFQAPFIILNTLIPVTEPFELTGARLPASVVPFAFGPARSFRMSFLERLENVLLDIHWTLFCTKSPRRKFHRILETSQ
ncbi:unnamed protein product [Allacma fusca]|uniref:Uncharacterized protein n=1 Tax=Allacma fusca TaxID=39272 RepID=A0A8J2KSP6_9HEXA|nr:unnamed protein product [Allacma fusca]